MSWVHGRVLGIAIMKGGWSSNGVPLWIDPKKKRAPSGGTGAALSFYNSALQLRITAIWSFRWPYMPFKGPFQAAFYRAFISGADADAERRCDLFPGGLSIQRCR